MINTFADCKYRKEEILSPIIFGMSLGWITTDPGLLDWSECTHPTATTKLCEMNCEGCGICPEGFRR